MEQSPPGTAIDLNRLSVIIAAVMLTYAVTPFIHLTDQTIGLQLPGFFLSIPLNFGTFTSIIAALLAASGTQWLLVGHPRHAISRRSRHWLLPALSAWVVGVPLNFLPVSPAWWTIFTFGGLLISGIMIAEYIAADPADRRYGLASSALTVLSFALFLLLVVSLRGAGLRLFLILPAIALAVFLAALKTMYLRLGEHWNWLWAGAIALVTTQAAAGLHYWHLTPLQYGLLLLGLAYGLVTAAVNWQETQSLRNRWQEPVFMLSFCWVLAVLLR